MSHKDWKKEEFYSKMAEFSQDGGNPIEAYAMQRIAGYIENLLAERNKELLTFIGEDENIPGYLAKCPDPKLVFEEVMKIRSKNAEKARIRTFITSQE